MTSREQIDQYRMAHTATRGPNRLKDATFPELVCAILPYFLDADTVEQVYDLKSDTIDLIDRVASLRLAEIEGGPGDDCSPELSGFRRGE